MTLAAIALLRKIAGSEISKENMVFWFVIASQMIDLLFLTLGSGFVVPTCDLLVPFVVIYLACVSRDFESKVAWICFRFLLSMRLYSAE